MSKPLLTLETLAADDRPFVDIDGERYDLAMPDDFGLLESASLASLMRKAGDVQERARALKPGTPLRPKLLTELTELLDDVLAAILLAPPAVRERLNSTQKLAVIAAFAPAVENRRQPPRTARRRNRSTSGSSSPSSRRRTARRSGTRCRSAS